MLKLLTLVSNMHTPHIYWFSPEFDMEPWWGEYEGLKCLFCDVVTQWRLLLMSPPTLALRSHPSSGSY